MKSLRLFQVLFFLSILFFAAPSFLGGGLPQILLPLAIILFPISLGAIIRIKLLSRGSPRPKPEVPVRRVAAQDSESVQRGIHWDEIFDVQPVSSQDRNESSEAPPNKQPQPAMDSEATPAIFISYRREDTSDVTGRIYDRLIQHFGKHSVFKDVDSIPLGVDFRKHLGDSVSRCDVLLTIIGKQWLGGDVGQRRLDDVRDFVRIEIEAALQRKIPVVPVLVQGVSVPRPENLPETLQDLAFRHGMPIRPDPDFHQDVDRLIRGIEGYLKAHP